MFKQAFCARRDDYIATEMPENWKVFSVFLKSLGKTLDLFEAFWVSSLKFQLYSLGDLNFDTFEVQMFKNAYYYFCPENWRCRDYIQTIRAEFATHPTCDFEWASYLHFAHELREHEWRAPFRSLWELSEGGVETGRVRSENGVAERQGSALKTMKFKTKLK